MPEVRLVGPNGEQVGIVRVEDALRLAEEADLDLVEVAPSARPPVCKLMDYGKFKYEAAQKARDARRNQANTVLKEIRFRLKIDAHDYETKKGHVERFLGAGDKVKVMIMFRGREQSRPEMGIRLLQRLAEDVIELGTVESSPRQDGRNMTMVLAPTKRKSEARDEKRGKARPNARGRDRQQTAPEQPEANEQVQEPRQTEAAPAPQQAPAPVAAEVPAEPAAAAEPAPAAEAPTDAAPAAPAKPRPATPRPAPKPVAKPAAAKPKPAARAPRPGPRKPA
ncbi:translation initiation factor IF-3 [Serinibacter salmoneus]|uniref:translation initiation factor IF-3 n=1 Tax=Serinibacter salmoneus TaxID=556530 RepID=UPI001FE7BAE6